MDFELSAFISIVASLFLLEVLLSVDNALVNASIARSLPPAQRASAVRLGIILAAAFRIVMLLLASLIIHNKWLRIIGALYLIYLMLNHLGQEVIEEGKEVKKHATYKKIVMRIALTDVVFSIDNVVSAIGLSRNILYVITGVLIGIAAIILMSQIMVKIIDRFSRLANTAYIIVGFIGASLLIEEFKHLRINASAKFLVIVGITLFTIWYEKSAGVRRLTGPILHRLQIILGLPGDLWLILRGVFGAVSKTR